MKIGTYDFDPVALQLERNGVRVDIPARALEVLRLLAETPGRIVDKPAIFMRVWPDGFVEENNLWQQIHLLRKALAADPRVSIENSPRRGYRLVLPRERTKFSREAYVAAVVALVVLGVSGALWISHPRIVMLGEQARADYQRGLYHLSRRQPTDLAQATTYFEKTIAEAPSSPDGYAGRAVLEIVRAQRAPDGPSATRAYAASFDDERAAFARGEHPYALLARGARTRSRGDFERASMLLPNDPTIASWYSFFELASGDPVKAQKIEARASQLDPSAPIPLKLLGIASYYAHDFAKARGAFRDELAVYSADDEGWYYLGLVDRAMLHPVAAREDFSRALTIHGGSARNARLAIAALDAVAGMIPQARAALASSGRRPAAGYGREAVDVAALWMALGRPTRAVASLEKIDRTDSLADVAIANDPRLSTLPFRRERSN